MPTLYWLQCGGCGGDTMSLLCAEMPDLVECLTSLDIDVLWHPSLSNLTPAEQQELIGRILSGDQPLDLLCVEGTIIRGPSGTGMYDVFHGRPRKDLVQGLANRAKHVLAVGTCASFGGVSAGAETNGSGLQFLKSEKGGFLGHEFVSASGLPVINLPGCPCHPSVITGTLTALLLGEDLRLTEYHTPSAWYNTLVHQGCTRDEYHEYRVEEGCFGEKGCMFFHMGCRGPLTYGPCNKIMWSGRSCKTRIGVPCFGCTSPEFPLPYPFFETRNIEGIPLELPPGVSRAHYLAYKGMAAAAAPDRLKSRETGI